MTIRRCQQTLFVCLENICRSPTVEGVFAHLVGKAGLSAHIVVDSAGTAAYHVGQPPDARSIRAAAQKHFMDG